MKNVFVCFFPSIQSNEFEYLNVILLIDLLFRFGNRNPGRIDRYCMYIYVLLCVLVEHSENYSCGFSVSQLSTYNTYCVDATPHVLGSSLIRIKIPYKFHNIQYSKLERLSTTLHNLGLLTKILNR